MDIMRIRVLAEWLAKPVLLSVFTLTTTYVAASPPSGTPDTPAMGYWKALIPTIQDVLIQSGITAPAIG